ncbi:MAG: hypothetical protein Q9216_006029 [Gyalolechia sp. 2 TL-2023]
MRAKFAVQSTAKCQSPPIAPYWIPFFAHLFLFLFDLNSLLTNIVNRIGNPHPIRIPLGTEEFIFVTGPRNLKLVWKNSQSLTAKAGHLIALRTILDTPERSMGIYRADTSGIGKEPLLRSNVAPERRVWHLTHQPIVDCLSGTPLTIFTDNFQNSMIKRIEQYSFDDQWTEMPDLFTFMCTELMHVQLELLCGTFFLEHNPGFVNDFWQFHHALIHLRKGLPRWMISQSCKARSVCLDAVEKWHEALQTHDPDVLIDTGKFQDARFGNEIMRSRRRIIAKIGGLDKQTAASADLGMLWALNANPAIATSWLLLEIVRDPSLHPTIHREIATSSRSLPQSDSHSTIHGGLSSGQQFVVPLLSNCQLLQSMYTETLRLRTATLMIHSPEFSDFNFNQWLFPKDKLILISSHTAHMDRESWHGSGEKGAGIPVEEFCAERFLTWKGNTESRSNTSSSQKPPGSEKDGARGVERDRSHLEQASFTMAGHAGKWIPYGGGPGICPGRHFSKNLMLLTSALMFSAFEIELNVEKGWKPKMDMRYYGLGVLPPQGKVPFKIRRRQTKK